MTAWQFWIDRGGTFTDIVARDPQGRLHSRKLLSRQQDGQDAALRGIGQLLGLAPGAKVPPAQVAEIRMGTTVATNALLQRCGAPTLLVTNDGLQDLLVIGDQARPDLFDLTAARPAPLHARVLGVSGRVAADGAVLVPLDEAAVAAGLAEARAAGCTACAVALIHGWAHPHFEQRIAALARDAGFEHVAASHEVSALPRLVPRAEIAVVDATLTPVLRAHVDHLAESLPGIALHFMQSHGGLTDAARFRGRDAVLSGPAGGIVGAGLVAAAAGLDHIIGFDMGGTSTDVALYPGRLLRTDEARLAGTRLRTPMLAIHSIAAGGGSVLRFDGARCTVGPDSAGADPGPACTRNGGPLTVTDANLCVGRIHPACFPASFGADGTAPLDVSGTEAAFARLAEAIGVAGAPQAADGFLDVAVAAMAGAIRSITLAEGHDPRDFALMCFGGAAGQLACRVAEALDLRQILLHPLGGVLSAYGMGLAPFGALHTRAIEQPFTEALAAQLPAMAEAIAASLAPTLPGHGPIEHARHASLRVHGAEALLDIPLAPFATMRQAFAEAHRARFGTAPADAAPMVASLTAALSRPAPPPAPCPPAKLARRPPAEARLFAHGRWHSLPIHPRDTLPPGTVLPGPAMIAEPTGTILVDPGWQARVQDDFCLRLTRLLPLPARPVPAPAGQAVRGQTGRGQMADPVLLEVFHGLLMGAARQSGTVLQRLARSVNIRERLDFSCAVFDAQGVLVANAPHVPVHLGAMGISVRAVLAQAGGRLRPGDAVALNDPAQGGTHLPDITVVTPVFDQDGVLQAAVASRAHHADIGGITPGSTPPFSTRLEQEGVVLDFLKLRDRGRVDDDAVLAALQAGPFPARDPHMNLADLRAQLAANDAAAGELARIAARHGWPLLCAYMNHVLDNGGAQIRRLLPSLRPGRHIETLENGAVLCVRITPRPDGLCIDFAGSSAQSAGNFNAPPAIARAVVLFVLRCLLAAPIPLNEGCLRPITLAIPPGSLLDPAPGAAVVAGNTEVSQALCNALLAAFGVAAHSQGTMNNLVLGGHAVQYYETIGGGAGGSPAGPGASATQLHMTNTRMTDPELLEARLPVRVARFAVRAHSGGDGAQPGGDGIVRALALLAPMSLSFVSGSRAHPPAGAAGGLAGLPGRQWIDHAQGGRTMLPAIAQAGLEPGDTLVIETPGGGGFGPPIAKTSYAV